MSEKLVYITFERITETKARVVSENYSYSRLTEDQKVELHIHEGYPVVLPIKPIIEQGKRLVLYTNPLTQEVWYDLEDIAKSVDFEELKTKQELMQAALDELILGGA